MNPRRTVSNSSQPTSELSTQDFTPDHSAVLRIAKSKRGWVPIPRDLINDERLQFDTRAIASWLLSRSEGWQIRLGALPRVLQRCAGPGERLGRDRIRRCLRELDSAGCLTRARSRTSGGRWVWHVELADSTKARAGPIMDGSAVYGSTVAGSPVAGQGVDLFKTLSSGKSEYIKPTTTTTPMEAECAASNAAGVVPETKIHWPEFLNGSVLATARGLIGACPVEFQQPILDEMGAMYTAGKVLYPIGLLRSLIERAKAGQFVPNRSIAAQSSTSNRAIASTHGDKPPKPSPARVEPLSPIGHQTLAKIRERLKGSGA